MANVFAGENESSPENSVTVSHLLWHLSPRPPSLRTCCSCSWHQENTWQNGCSHLQLTARVRGIKWIYDCSDANKTNRTTLKSPSTDDTTSIDQGTKKIADSRRLWKQGGLVHRCEQLRPEDWRNKIFMTIITPECSQSAKIALATSSGALIGEYNDDLHGEKKTVESWLRLILPSL